jgi:hypothetical protein
MVFLPYHSIAQAHSLALFAGAHLDLHYQSHRRTVTFESSAGLAPALVASALARLRITPSRVGSLGEGGVETSREGERASFRWRLAAGQRCARLSKQHGKRQKTEAWQKTTAQSIAAYAAQPGGGLTIAV